ncbi:hypothetical protein [Microvirga lotononidis]|uniref:Uncharacterized protein n=1 Tax=Microvirga lotononidis TaxID=864069 RepID=I4YKM2_9HYPH|nr:hypothetical protein [Microvirga lotononidis]EIM24514.1 hypothetical protein MicloDRAFT_00052270 [Microvirga lotononidis]WQO26539.1 hypothetical protein U0023_17870 [Microvirga lotononidis]
MNKTLILLGASIVTFGTISSGAEARLVRYEINGKHYSYSTNNRAQMAEAKKRIAAAKAAETAKAKAEAERAKNPLVMAFGSTTQKEATEAHERLEKILSGPTEYMAVSQPARNAGDPDRKVQEKQPAQASAAKPPQQPIAIVRTPAKPILASASTAVASLVIAEPVDPQRRTKVKSVSFDVQSGIKTTIMIDGTIEEEPFDSSALTFLAPEPEKVSSLTAFVNQLRKTAPEDTTGSIKTSAAEPDNTSLIRHR